MTNVKNVIMKKKIEGAVYDLLVKTSAEQVTYENTTVKAKVEEIAGQITTLTSGKADANAVVTAISASSANGKVTYTKNGTDTDVVVKGVVVNPTYDEATRTLTLPVTKTDGTTENVVMALGRDMVVKSGTYNTSSKKIILTLTDDSTVEIPASALVDIYTGGTTNTATVSVDSNNVITADVRVSSKAGNTVQTITEEGKEGIYVPTVDTTNFVEKVAGKGLSTNDYTTAEKEKLASLENYDDTALTTAIGNKARVLISATEPEDLTDKDLWLQDITE